MANGKPEFTLDGVETVFAVAHVGHALLCLLLIEKHQLSADCRIIFTTSGTHDPKEPGSPIPPAWSTPAQIAKAEGKALQNANTRYPTAKLANIFFNRALERRAIAAGKKWQFISWDPGFAPGGGSKLTRSKSLLLSRLMLDMPAPLRVLAERVGPYLAIIASYAIGMIISTPLKSGEALAHLATDRSVQIKPSNYIQIYNEKPSSEESYDVAKQEELWCWTVNELALDTAEKRRWDTMS